MRFLVPSVALLFIALGPYVQAQSTNATLVGVVADQSKALIAEARVAATSVNTGIEYDASTDPSGTYNLPNLPPGSYQLKVEKSGFKTLIRPDVTLNVQDVVSLNFVMQIGSMSETIRVVSIAAAGL